MKKKTYMVGYPEDIDYKTTVLKNAKLYADKMYEMYGYAGYIYEIKLVKRGDIRRN